MNVHETLQVAAAGQLQPSPNTPPGLCETEADDGKHASSVIEVEVSLLEAKLDGGVEGDVLGVPRGSCGFKRFGVTCSTKLWLFFVISSSNHFGIVSLFL